MSLLARRCATLRGGLIWPSGEVSLTVQISEDISSFIQHHDIGLRCCEREDERSRSVSGRDKEGHDAAVVNMPDVFQTASLDLRT